ncbi:MAG: hypothetical protein C4562_03215 [Actinobacteria bacterium]|nr:MAG: hypothetical protein C4562_03215 [Actinomycetota bacterium]
MSKLAVIGDNQTCLGFSSTGAHVLPFDKENSKASVIAKIKEGDYAVVLVTEDAYQKLRPEIELFDSEFLPSIMIIPSPQGKQLGLADEHVNEIVKKAVGISIE